MAHVFEQVFGYGLAVDPTTYHGEIVEKSNANATHDGRVLSGPISSSDVRDGYVYQRLVRTEEASASGEVETVDLRTPLYGRRVPFVYIARRPVEARFLIPNNSVELAEASGVYSPDELRLLAVFAGRMGLDYGELDVLRDKDSGLIYIVDVANTPAGPPKQLPPGRRREAVERLADAFDSLVTDAVAGRVQVGAQPVVPDSLTSLNKLKT